jgi:hypothetical protein
VVPNQLAVAVVQSLTTERFQEQVEEEGEGEAEEEAAVPRQRVGGTCYGAALGARTPRGPVLVAGNFWCMVFVL